MGIYTSFYRVVLAMLGGCIVNLAFVFDFLLSDESTFVMYEGNKLFLTFFLLVPDTVCVYIMYKMVKWNRMHITFTLVHYMVAMPALFYWCVVGLLTMMYSDYLIK
ncbi:hypothetical protein RsTz2092_12250 [Deferribacterales bacterium RsTz2092]